MHTHWFFYWFILHHLREKVIRRINMKVEQEISTTNGTQEVDANACVAVTPPPSSTDSVTIAWTSYSCSSDPLDPDPPPTEDYFDKLQATWRTELEAQLPTGTFLDQDGGTFVSCLEAITQAITVKNEAQKVQDMIAKQKPVNDDELAEAKKAVSDAELCVQDIMATCQLVAGDTLQNLNDFLTTFDDSLLVQYTLLNSFTSKRAAEWCQQGSEETERVLRLVLHSAELQRRMLLAGGAAEGNYGRAMQLYEQIVESQSQADAVLERLALAVALELCAPLTMFGTKALVDPILRYIHYEQAYLFGELDEVFSQFTVQELRMVVNSDANNDQLGWCRESLQNYRPDHVTTDSVQWRYCLIVRTDVPYTHPVWYKEPRSYDQILSGGGECGPRAWYGRFACRAFGIPVWGVRQPGHAAMARWTSEGWMTCLGAAFKYSYWGGRGGDDFLLETQARSALESEEAYLQQVLRLEWMGQFCNESNKSVRENCVLDATSPWWALSMMQRKILVAAADAVMDSPTRKGGKLMYPKSLQVTKVERLKERSATCAVTTKDGGKIIIPATSCSNPTKATNDVLFLDSFLGGKQLHLRGDATVEYTLTADLLTPTAKQYNLTCLVCTVHRNEKPVLLTVGNDSDDDVVAVISVEFPYTMGMWQETAPVVVELGGSDVTNTTLTFARQSTICGITVKEIKLTPVEGARDDSDHI
jgi:hypothetical protein